MFIEAREPTSQRSGVLLLAAACFAAGLSAGALLLPSTASNPHVARQSVQPTPIEPIRSGYPADVIRVIDGDTFEARVRVWPGMDVTTKVRLRGIDAAELHARCDAERTKALAARCADRDSRARRNWHLCRRRGQIRWPRRRFCFDRKDAGRFCCDAWRRLCPRLWRRPARELVRLSRHCRTSTSVPIAARR